MQDDNFTGLDDARRGRLPRPRRSLSSRGAIYHLSVRTSSRAKGQSARAAAAYIQRTAEYRRDQAEELVYTESGHMPAWAEAAPTSYWDAADLYERANGRLCKTLEFALPLALTGAERRALAVGFAHHLTDGERLPYTLAIHAGAGTNPHCHLLISERGNDGLERAPEQWFRRYNAAEPAQGGARKSTALHPKAWLEETREVWAEQTNLALELAGQEVRIDHRSLEAQDAARVPSVKLGPRVQAMEAAGLETELGAEYRRREQVNAELAELTRVQEEIEHERRRQREQELERGDSHPPRGRAGVEREGGDVGRDAGRLAGGRGEERGAGLAGGGKAGGRTPEGASGGVGRAAGRRGPAPASPHGPAQPGGPQSAHRAHLAAGVERAVAAGLEPGPVAGGAGERGDSAARELDRGDDLRGSGAVSTQREEERAAARERRQERLLAMIEGKVERSRQQAREQEQARRRERARERQREREREQERERERGRGRDEDFELEP